MTKKENTNYGLSYISRYEDGYMTLGMFWIPAALAVFGYVVLLQYLLYHSVPHKLPLSDYMFSEKIVGLGIVLLLIAIFSFFLKTKNGRPGEIMPKISGGGASQLSLFRELPTDKIEEKVLNNDYFKNKKDHINCLRMSMKNMVFNEKEFDEKIKDREEFVDAVNLYCLEYKKEINETMEDFKEKKIKEQEEETENKIKKYKINNLENYLTI